MRKKLLIGILSFVAILGIMLVILDDPKLDNQKKPNYAALSIPELHELSDEDDKEAQGVLAYSYQEGINVKKDYAQSLELYLKSAENGSTTSMINIAYLYSNGIGVEQNHKEAFNWNLRAAENGDSSGMFNVSRKYEFGLGVERDPKKATYWLEKSGKEI